MEIKMNDVLVRADAALVSAGSESEFSWAAAVAGAFVTSTVIFFLLFLGAGVGLSLFTVPEVPAGSGDTTLTLGALYFLFSLAFGGAVGGYIAGRLMGPVFESSAEEHFHSSAHGLVSWAIAVIATATMAAISGLALAGPSINAAAILGAANQAPSQQQQSSADTGGYWVDMLFRPAAPAGTATVGATPATAGSQPVVAARPADPQLRAEAGRILTVGLAHGAMLSQADRDELSRLVSQGTGADTTEANRRVDDVQARIHQDAVTAAETARKGARFISLWLAASLVLGGFVAAFAAVMGRNIDDKARASLIQQSPIR
jgi:hypothetical protein